MAAAIADFRPARYVEGKIKKKDGENPPPVELVRNPDVLAELSANRSRPGQLVVGFAAETDDVLANARAKLARKGCDLLVVNEVGEHKAFGSEENEALVLDADGGQIPVPYGPQRSTRRAGVGPGRCPPGLTTLHRLSLGMPTGTPVSNPGRTNQISPELISAAVAPVSSPQRRRRVATRAGYRGRWREVELPVHVAAKVPYGLRFDQKSAVSLRRSSSVSLFAHSGAARTCCSKREAEPRRAGLVAYQIPDAVHQRPTRHHVFRRSLLPHDRPSSPRLTPSGLTRRRGRGKRSPGPICVGPLASTCRSRVRFCRSAPEISKI